VTNLITAEDLARRARVDGKEFRGWLREEIVRGNPLVADHHHGQRWLFTSDVADQLLTAFQLRSRSTSSGEFDMQISFVARVGSPIEIMDGEVERLRRAFDRSVPATCSLPVDPGIYSFWATQPSALRDLKLDEVDGEASLLDRPLYIGKAEASVSKRVGERHFQTGKTGWSTARRTFAALLDLTSCPRPTSVQHPSPKQALRSSTNYGLIHPDEEKLTNWMSTNLVVRASASEWVPLEELEYAVMLLLRPPLNLKKANWPNPWRHRIEQARAKMREKARRG
jgi:hypothetical protein